MYVHFNNLNVFIIRVSLTLAIWVQNLNLIPGNMS